MRRRPSTIRDARWSTGVEPLRRAKFKDQSEVGGDSSETVPADEAQLVTFGQDEECTDAHTSATFGLGTARAYFVQSGAVFSVYSALLRDGETSVASTPSFFKRPLNCSIILLAGNHFAVGVFENDRLVAHRAIRRYVVRAKQGGAQCAIDKTKGSCKSAGASLRRYNAKAMREEIRELLCKKWAALLAAMPLVFLRCASYQRGIFIARGNEDAPLRKGDARLRSIPFETKRPLVDEVKRTWERLGEVKDHGTIEEFEQEMEGLRERLCKRTTALQRKGRRQEEAPSTFDDETDDEESGRDEKWRKRKEAKEQAEKEKKAVKDRFPEIAQDLRNALFAAILDNSKAGARLEQVLKCVEEGEKREYLLELGAKPALRNAQGKTPYNCAKGKVVKGVFCAWRAEWEEEAEGEKGNNRRQIDWVKAQIPLPVAKSAEQLAREAEKKKAKRERKRAKEQEMKEQERKEKEEQAKQAVYMALPDREKRALAIEARLARMESCVTRNIK